MHLPVRAIVAAERLLELLSQEVARVSFRLDLRGGPRPERQLRLDGGAFRHSVDDPLLPHRRQHQLAAPQGALRIGPRRQRRRRPDQGCDERRFGKREIARPFSEQRLRYLFRSVQTGAEVHPIQVQLENLILGQLRLEHHGERSLLQLPRHRASIRQEQRPRKLLSDRAGALDCAEVTRVVHNGPRDREQIDPEMMMKPPVFDGDHRAPQVG